MVIGGTELGDTRARSCNEHIENKMGKTEVKIVPKKQVGKE